jgi:sigma-B regulation protein RsbU (phosphoserine phosphatase)
MDARTAQSELERKVENLSKLVRINGIINATLDIGKLLHVIMEVIKDIMNTEASTLLLFDEENRDLVFKVALGGAGSELTEKYRVGMGQGLAGWVAENRKTAYVNDVYADDRFDPNYDRQTGFVTRSLLCAPLLFKGRLLGVIQAINPVTGEEFTGSDIELFEVFADQASLAVQNAIFFENALAEARMKTEMKAAQMIQNASIPPVYKQFGSLYCTARSFNAREVGGVFHGLKQLHRSGVVFFLGDVHEKGVPGGLRAARMYGLCRALVETRDRPEEVMGTLRHVMASGFQEPEQLSILAGVIDPVTRNCTFLKSGDIHPFLVRQGQIRYIRAGQTDLKGNQPMRKVNLSLQSGDQLVLLSHQFLRLRDSNGNIIELKQLMKELLKGSRSREGVVDSLFAFMDTFTGGYWKRSDYSLISVLA